MNATKRIISACLVLSAVQLCYSADEPLPKGFVLDEPRKEYQKKPPPPPTLTDADFQKPQEASDKSVAAPTPPKELTPAQIKARAFMQGIADQRSRLWRKAIALGIQRQFVAWPKGYTFDEETKYLSGEMGTLSAFQFERKCKQYISELEAMIANALKNVRSEKVRIDD